MVKSAFYYFQRVTKRCSDVHGYFRDGRGKDSLYVERANYPKSPPPYNLTVLKGTKNVIISKKFANFLLTHPIATDYFHWIKASFEYPYFYHYSPINIIS